jgi:SAM-dependent methyltransferase
LTTSTFDAVSDAYDSTIPAHVAEHLLAKRLAFVSRHVPAGSLILDAGCGTGTFAGRLRDIGYRVLGIDASIGMLAGARNREVPVAQAIAQRLPFPDDTFDGFVSVAVLHHLGSTDMVRRAIDEMIRVLRPGGRAVIWDHNPLNPYWPILMARVPQDDGSERLVPRGEILNDLARHEVNGVEHWRLGFVPDFTPRRALGAAIAIERRLEAWPFSRPFASHNVFVVSK